MFKLFGLYIFRRSELTSKFIVDQGVVDIDRARWQAELHQLHNLVRTQQDQLDYYKELLAKTYQEE